MNFSHGLTFYELRLIYDFHSFFEKLFLHDKNWHKESELMKMKDQFSSFVELLLRSNEKLSFVDVKEDMELVKIEWFHLFDIFEFQK